jgi:CubicO group peptidase (beta-lactamase class C family)
MLRREFLALTPLPAAMAFSGVRTPAAARRQPPGARSEARFEAIAERVRAAMRDHRVPGVGLGVLADGHTTLRGFGVTSLDDPQPINEDTLFTIASVSKTTTATAVMKLVHDCVLDLRAPIQRYVPDFRVLDDDTSRRVSLWHCLTHTPGWEGQLTTEDRGAGALAHFASTIMPTLPQLAPPGSVWSYNNAGFALSGRVIEQVTGKGIHDALRELVFAPLGLTRTATRLTDAMTYRLTLGHRERGTLTEVIRPFQTTSSTTAGGVLTSLRDIMRYAAFHLGDGKHATGAPYVSRSLLELMQTPQLRKNATTDEMGVGWHARTVGGVMTLAHGGTLNGHCLLLQLVPSRQLAFVVLTNHQDGWRLVQDVERAVLQRFAGVSLTPGQAIGHRGVNEAMTGHAQPLTVQPKIDDYLGVYRRPPLGAVEVRPRGDRLVITGINQPDARLVFYGPDVAYALDGSYLGTPYEFVRDSGGAVRWIRLNGRIARKDG